MKRKERDLRPREQPLVCRDREEAVPATCVGKKEERGSRGGHSNAFRRRGQGNFNKV